MIISNTGKYTLSLFSYLAMHTDDGFITTKEIAKKQNVPHSYLTNIVNLYVKNGLLKSRYGNKGGVSLSKNPSEYNLKEILVFTELNLSKKNGDSVFSEILTNQINEIIDKYLLEFSLTKYLELIKNSEVNYEKIS